MRTSTNYVGDVARQLLIAVVRYYGNTSLLNHGAHLAKRVLLLLVTTFLYRMFSTAQQLTLFISSVVQTSPTSPADVLSSDVIEDDMSLSWYVLCFP